MRKNIFPIAVVLAAVCFAGCTGPEQKLGRGLSNTFEIARWGEMRRSVEQNSVFARPGTGYYGVVHGFDRSLQRIGLGVYEVATFPLPSYDPILTKSYSADSPFPASYKPDLFANPLYSTDTYTGFSGGDVAPFIIGSRFQVFDN